MPKPKHIQISVPTPCHQSWEGMTPDGEGRFCGHCSKTVIDFTGWNDKALFEFFSKDRGHVCGRFFATQLERPIHIPSQPHSRLYRLVIAMGLTLIFVQGEQVHAQAKLPAVSVGTNNGSWVANNLSLFPGTVSGRVTGESEAPISGVAVQVYDRLTHDYVCRTITDEDGRYNLILFRADTYDLVFSHPDYEFENPGNIAIFSGTNAVVNMVVGVKAFDAYTVSTDKVYILSGVVGTRMPIVEDKAERKAVKGKKKINPGN